MNRRQFVLSIAGASTLGWAGWKTLGLSSRIPGHHLVTGRTHALGTEVKLSVLHPDKTHAHQAIQKAFAELERVESLLSLYRPSSQVSRLNQAKVLENAHPDLLAILRTSRELSERSNGLFDVTVQPLWQLYSRRQATGGLPSDAELAATLRDVDYRQVQIDGQTIRLQGQTTEITLNGIAQGFAADAVGATLHSEGISHALIDTGEFGSMGSRMDQTPWKVAVKDPRQNRSYAALTALEGRSLATSGDYETKFSDDYRHHHLLDPRTGKSPTSLASVSVVAPTATLADGLSTTAFLLGESRGRELIASTPGADALFIRKDGLRTETPDFPRIG